MKKSNVHSENILTVKLSWIQLGVEEEHTILCTLVHPDLDKEDMINVVKNGQDQLYFDLCRVSEKLGKVDKYEFEDDNFFNISELARAIYLAAWPCF